MKADSEGEGLVTSILICDDEEERRLQIGRGWPHRELGLGEVHASSSMLRSLGVSPNRGQSVVLDMGAGKLLTTFNLSSDGLKNALVASVMSDGVAITLNGSRIEEYFERQGIDVPQGTFPQRLQTRVPVTELVDFERLISAAVDGVAHGHLMDLRLSVVDGLTRSHERYPPLGNMVLLNSRHFLRVVKAAMNAIPLVQVLNLASNANKTGDMESALLSKQTPVTDSMLGDDINMYAFSLVVMYKDRMSAYLKDTQVHPSQPPPLHCSLDHLHSIPPPPSCISRQDNAVKRTPHHPPPTPSSDV